MTTTTERPPPRELVAFVRSITMDEEGQLDFWNEVEALYEKQGAMEGACDMGKDYEEVTELIGWLEAIAERIGIA